MVKKEVTVTNRAGIHSRPAAMIVRLANRYKSHIFIAKEDEKINAKSIMGIITLGVSCNTVISIEAEGPDEEEVVDELVRLIENRFEE